MLLAFQFGANHPAQPFLSDSQAYLVSSFRVGFVYGTFRLGAFRFV